MARSKPTPKPLFAVKGDFEDSLNRFTQEAIMLLQAVEFVQKIDDVPQRVKEMLKPRADAFRAAMSVEDEREDAA